MEHLTLVGELVDFRDDLTFEHVWSQQPRADMVMVDLINSEAGLSTHREPPESDSTYASRKAQSEIDVLAAFDVNDLVYFRIKCNDTWEMPIIEFKTIVNRERKDRLDERRGVREARYRSAEAFNPASV